MRHERLYLNDIVEAADHIAAVIAGADIQVFQGSEMLRSAVVQKLGLIGEAAARVSTDLTVAIPRCPGPRLWPSATSSCMPTSASTGMWYGVLPRIGARSCECRSPISSPRTSVRKTGNDDLGHFSRDTAEYPGGLRPPTEYAGGKGRTRSKVSMLPSQFILCTFPSPLVSVPLRPQLYWQPGSRKTRSSPTTPG